MYLHLPIEIIICVIFLISKYTSKISLYVVEHPSNTFLTHKYLSMSLKISNISLYIVSYHICLGLLKSLKVLLSLKYL